MFDACICIDADDGPDFVSDRIVTARKQWKCVECGHAIHPGDRYEYVYGKWDGDTDEFRTCLPCLNIRKSLFRCGWTYGGIWDDIHESICRGQRTELWVCDCGKALDHGSGDWRWNGLVYEHHHGGQEGHFAARKIVLDAEEYCICPERQ